MDQIKQKSFLLAQKIQLEDLYEKAKNHPFMGPSYKSRLEKVKRQLKELQNTKHEITTTNDLSIMKIVNLLGYTASILNYETVEKIPDTPVTEDEIIKIEPYGPVAKVKYGDSRRCCVSEQGDFVVFDEAKFELENLPDPEDGTVYLVPNMVRRVAKNQGRTDCCSIEKIFYQDDPVEIIAIESLSM